MNCSKNDCFVLNDYPLRKDQNVVVNPKCNGTVKIFVSTDRDPDKETESKTEQTDDEPKKKKSMCFCFSKPKKNVGKIDSIDTRVLLENHSQTLTQGEKCELDFESLVKNAKSTGTTNTNAIIYPKDNRCSGDGMLCLQNWLRMETQCNSRVLEEILQEIYKLRREMQNMRETLETTTNVIKEQQHFKPILVKKRLDDILSPDIDLERKTNSLSFKNKEKEPITEKEMLKKATADVEIQPSCNLPKKKPEKKKPCGWLWCK